MTMPITGAIFDMDGTILDSGPAWDRIPIDVLTHFGYAPLPTLLTDVVPLGMVEYVPYLRETYRMTQSEDEVSAFMETLIARCYYEEAELKPGALEFLRCLRRNGVALTLATATERRMVEPALARTGALPLFDRILTCSEVGKGKREPDIFRQALAGMGTEKATTWLFEDALYSIQTAKAEGFPVCAVDDGASRFQQAEIRALADCFLPSFSQWRQRLPFAAELRD